MAAPGPTDRYEDAEGSTDDCDFDWDGLIIRGPVIPPRPTGELPKLISDYHRNGTRKSRLKRPDPGDLHRSLALNSYAVLDEQEIGDDDPRFESHFWTVLDALRLHKAIPRPPERSTYLVAARLPPRPSGSVLPKLISSYTDTGRPKWPEHQPPTEARDRCVRRSCAFSHTQLSRSSYVS